MKTDGRKIWLCGDSTAASYRPEQAPLMGWGQALAEMLPEREIRNEAMAGRSTKTFLAEGRLDRLDGQVAPGDLMLIQFGHNDEGDKPERHTEPWTEFKPNLEVFFRFARERGARPVLLTPICIRTWRDGVLQESHGEYLRAMRAAAEEGKVPLIDLYGESRRIVAEAGEEGSRALYIGERQDPSHPENRIVDDTHTRRAGAEAFAARVLAGLKTLGLLEED